MRFSVVIAAYNAEATIGAAVASAFAQTLPPVEVIVADDASTDGTALVAEQHGATVIRRPVNGGEAAAKNTAVGAASADWIALLDADDTYEPDRLAAIAAVPDADIITTDAYVVVDGKIGRRYYRGPTGARWAEGDPRIEILSRSFIFGAPAVRRAVWIDAGGMDERDRRHAADWPLWVRLILSGARVALVDEPLYRYNIVTGSLSDSRTTAYLSRRAAMLAAIATPTATDRERQIATEHLADVDRNLALVAANRELWAGRRPRRAFLRVAANGGYRKRHRADAALAAIAPRYARSRMTVDPDRIPRY